MNPKAITIPMNGARKIKAAILRMMLSWIASKPFAMMAAPAKPPISVWEEEDGIPFHQVIKFHAIAAITPDKIIGRVINSSTTVLDTVLAIPNPPIIHLAIKNATKLKNAAHITAWNGVRTLVDTMVAIELAAS